MTDETRLLKEALLNKEMIQEFLANLDRRMESGSVPPQTYEQMKSDYRQKMTTAVSQIAGIKNGLKLKLEETRNRANMANMELENLRTRQATGQLSFGQYQRASGKLLKRIATINSDISNLQLVIAAKSSIQLFVTKAAFPRWAFITAVCAAAVIVLGIGGFISWKQQWIQIPWASETKDAGQMSWGAMTSSTTKNLWGIWGSSPADVFATGDGGTIMHYDGKAWSAMTSGTTNYLAGIWGDSSSDIFTAGYQGLILYYNGKSWGAMTSGSTNNLEYIWGSSSSDIFAVGNNGTILHYDGKAWGTMTSGTANNLWGIWGRSSSDVFATGRSGTILHYDGKAWGTITSGTQNDLFGIWGRSSSEVFAVGDKGTILHYDGKAWNAMTSGTPDALISIWGSSSSNVFAVGNNGTMLHYDGKTWGAMTSGTTNNFTVIWGNSSSNVFAVGYNGTILHYSTAVTGAPGSTLQQQRASVVQFLKQINDTNNNFEDFLSSPEISNKLNSDDPDVVLAGVDAIHQQIDNIQLQVQALIPPADIPELAELKVNYLKVATFLGQIFQEFGTAIQNRDADKIRELVSEISEYSTSPDVVKFDELQKSLLAKYNIIAFEVDYREAGTPPNNAQEQRAIVVQFLKEINDAENNLADNSSAAMNSDAAYLSVLNTMVQQFDICRNQIEALTPPSDIPELAELKSEELTALNLVRQLFNQMISAVQNNDTDQENELNTKISQLTSSPEVLKINELKKSLIQEYSITDSEIDYRTTGGLWE